MMGTLQTKANHLILLKVDKIVQFYMVLALWWAPFWKLFNLNLPLPKYPNNGAHNLKDKVQPFA